MFLGLGFFKAFRWHPPWLYENSVFEFTNALLNHPDSSFPS